jgi:hypothetical protein
MIFVGVRRGMDRIAGDVKLLVAVARRLSAEGRLMGRARLSGGLGEAVRGVEEGIRGAGGGREPMVCAGFCLVWPGFLVCICTLFDLNGIGSGRFSGSVCWMACFS